MNVASLELCKELFQLSGWGYYPLTSGDESTHFQWRSYEGKTTGSFYYSYAEDYTAEIRDPFDGRRPTAVTHHIQRVAPAYDLGYLLRKLPDYCHIKKHPVEPGTYRYTATYRYTLTEMQKFGFEEAVQMADTPEDAACKLAIQMFKQGVLQELETPQGEQDE